MQLNPTGERMILEHYRSSPEDYVIYLMHVASYQFAEQFTRGRRVLDYGCGSGYGSAQIARSATHVTAVDMSRDAVAYAMEEFCLHNLDFHVIDRDSSLPFGRSSFDVVLSFQVFEHVLDTEHYLTEIRRVLAPGGKLLLITPDRSTRLLPLQRPWNRWHVHEYSRGELERVLMRHFDRVEILGMTGKPETIGFELRRCNRIKWLMLPFTLPLVPDRLRVAGLNLVHRIRGSRRGIPKEYPFDVADIEISASASPSMNLVALASY